MSKEIFLREKMYELHLFTIKLLITFSSTTLAFSVGLLSLFEKDHIPEASFILVSGWGAIVISIVLILAALFEGLALTYDYYNNIVDGRPEIDGATSKKETLIHRFVFFSSLLLGIGIFLVLIFVFINFL